MAIDVYNGTGVVNWRAVKEAGHSLGIVKATEGATFTDKAVKRNLSAMASAGMIRGVYHFFHVGTDAATQANHFYSVATAAGFDPLKELPMVVDLEDISGLTRFGSAVLRASVEAFVTTLEKLTSGRKCMLYGSWDYLNRLQGGYGGHPLWLAQYTSDSEPHTLPTGWKDYILWQYSESGRVPGISGAVVDLDRFNPALFGGGEEGLRKWIAEN